ncbi:MAG: Gfo/Idh/MocA family oxidoreductase [Opitutales bacterium]|nr:Gfo/Idh/MocA family oxidoreductase [Opitutales bacterium]
MSERILKIGLLGCGNNGQTHAEAAANSPFVEIVACADLDLVRAKAFADRFHIPQCFDSLRSMVEGGGCDMLLFSTYPAHHLAQIREACELGARAILCEKALTMTVDEAEEVQRIAESHGALVCEGLMYRHHPQIQKGLELVRGGAIGDVCYIHGYFSAPSQPDPSNWRHRKEDGGGAMAAKGCYMIDALCQFAGKPALSVYSKETVHPETGVEIGHTGTLCFEGALTGQFESNHRSVWREELHIMGTAGTLCIPHAVVTKSQPRHIDLQLGGAFEHQPRQTKRFDFEVANSYQLQLENMRACIFGHGEPVVPMHESVRNMRVTSALRKSAETGREELVS